MQLSFGCFAEITSTNFITLTKEYKNIFSDADNVHYVFYHNNTKGALFGFNQDMFEYTDIISDVELDFKVC